MGLGRMEDEKEEIRIHEERDLRRGETEFLNVTVSPPCNGAKFS